MAKKSNLTNIIFVILIIIFIIYIVYKNSVLTLDRFCIKYLKLADRIMNNDSSVRFESYVYLKDPVERLKKCKISMKQIHKINKEIENERPEKREYLRYLYKCMSSNNFNEYRKCFHNM